MDKSILYNNIVKAFEESYGWLGRQFAEEFLHVVATQIIQQHSTTKQRIRSHLLLVWEPGWFKSTLLRIAADLLGEQNCAYMSDITPAVFRGTVTKTDDAVEFVPPACKTTPFIVVTEMGSLTTVKGLLQLLLITLEEGIVTVGLASLAKLTELQRFEIAQMYNIQISNGRMTYRTTSSFLCATYDESYLNDFALVNRFDIMIPRKELNNELASMVDGNEFEIQNSLVEAFRDMIRRPPPDNLLTIWKSKLPKSIFHVGNINPRIMRSLKSYMLSMAFWEKNVTEDALLDRAKYLLYTQTYIKDRLSK